MMKNKILILAIIFVNLIFAQQKDVEKAKIAIDAKKYDEAINLLSNLKNERSVASEANYLLGKAYFAKKDFGKSKSSFEASLDYDDDMMLSRAGLISSLLQLKEFDKLQKIISEGEKIIKRKKDQNFYEYYFEVGNAYFIADSIDKAILFYSKSKEQNSVYAKTLVGLANCYFNQTVYSMAIENFKSAISLEPNNATYHYSIGKVYYKMRSYSDAARSFNSAIKLDSTNELYLFELADLFFKAKYWSDAAHTYGKYVKLKPKDETILEPFARSQYNAKMYKESIPNLEKLIKKESSQELQLMLAHSLYELGDYLKSANQYKLFPKDSLNKSSDLINFGRSLIKLKDTTVALEMFEKATEVDSNSIIIVAGDLASIYMAQKNFEKAVVQYERILSIDTKNISALFYSGYAYSILNKIEEAKNMFLRVTELRPNYLQGRIFLFRMLIELSNIPDATTQSEIILKQIDSTVANETDKSKIEKINLNYIDVYRSLASMEYKQKNYIKAIEFLNKAISYEQKSKMDETLHLFLAQMYNISGDKKNAVLQYNIVIKLNPKNAVAKKELKQIQ